MRGTTEKQLCFPICRHTPAFLPCCIAFLLLFFTVLFFTFLLFYLFTFLLFYSYEQASMEECPEHSYLRPHGVGHDTGRQLLSLNPAMQPSWT